MSADGPIDVVNPKTMPGAMELLPREQIAFQVMVDRIRRGYERFGFLPIETPVMEYRNILLTKSGGETEKQVYLVQSTGSLAQGHDPKFALRFDLTVPLARYVAEHENSLVFPFRRYQIQRVYRGESAQRGRFREFLQCDVDIVGKDTLGLIADAEIPVVISHVFRDLAVGPFTINISNRKILMGLLESLGVQDQDRRVRSLREIDKLDRRGRAHVCKSLADEPSGLSQEAIERLMEFVGLSGTNDEILESLKSSGVDGETFNLGVAELAQVMAALRDFQVPEEHVRINIAIARGLDYYTGTVYETMLDDHPEVGSVCSGGRYENLAGHYTKSHLPGVGISIGATRLFFQLRAAGLIGEAGASTVAVLVTELDPDLGSTYRKIASLLRDSGLNTEVHHEGWKLGKQLKYASRTGIRFAVIVGSNEAERGAAMLKDLSRGEQQEVQVTELAQAIRDGMERGVE
jgi:histidyl-tRNA synthetase